MLQPAVTCTLAVHLSHNRGKGVQLVYKPQHVQHFDPIISYTALSL